VDGSHARVVLPGPRRWLERRVTADLVVLAEDLSRVPIERLREVGVAMMVGGGEVVYEA
jgi:predicted amidohydrolase YtcJ